jgi:hypothetical protein
MMQKSRCSGLALFSLLNAHGSIQGYWAAVHWQTALLKPYSSELKAFLKGI